MDIRNLLENYVHAEKLSRTVQGYRMLCPYHKDNNPSFYISLEKGHCKCFSCGTYRDIFSFLVEFNVPFDIAIEFFFNNYVRERELIAGKDYVLGRKIPKSMLDRGVTIPTMQHFQVGYDDFEGRITIPMLYKEQVYGVKYRQYPKEFWFSSGFVKEQFIYNYEPTKERTYVEGEVDTWLTWQNGTQEVSALLGCDVTDAQETMMSKHEVINIALDNDIPGYRGAFKIHDLLKRDVDIWVVPYEAKDPGAIIDPKKWQSALANRRSFLEFEIAFQKRYRKEYYDILSKLKNR